MQAIILGIIQGLTEFLPVSSSAHLILLPYFLGWPASGLAFDVALNTGTFIAVLVYFFPVWYGLLTNGLIKRKQEELKLLSYLVIATVPAGIFGYFGEAIITDIVRRPSVAAVTLIIFGLVLWYVERSSKLDRSLDSLTWRDSLIIGASQALALIPGVSRSGITITSGLALGLTKETATRFSFLLLAPVSLGAAVTQATEVVHATNRSAIILGTLASFVVGVAAIHFMLHLLKRFGFAPYIWYRIIMGFVFLLLLYT